MTDTVLKPSRTGLAFSANRLWSLQNPNTDQQPFTVSSVITLNDELDHVRLQASLITLLTRYPTLSGGTVNGDEAQAREVATLIRTENLPDEAALLPRIDSLRQEPFDLENGPLLRLVVLKPAQGKTHLLVVAHQLILDRHALGLFIEELARLYSGGSDSAHYMDSTTAVLPEASAESITWWQKRLEGVAPLEFPLDRLRPPAQAYARQAFDWALDTQQSKRLHDMIQAQGITAEDLLLSVFATLVYRYTTSDDLIMGLIARSQPDVIGPLENLVPLRLGLDKTTTFPALLDQVRTASADGRDHYVPFTTLLNSISIEQDRSCAPLVQIAFSWVDTVADKQANLRWTVPSLQADTLDLCLVAFEQDGCIHLRFEYDGVILEQQSIRRIAEHYGFLLNSVLDKIDNTLYGLQIMSAQERETVLKTWNNTWVDFPHVCAHQLVEEQVARTPDRVAVIWRDEQITYAELNRRANQLAHYLRSLGVQPDDLIGIHLPRSIDMVVTVLAVSKSGAGYVSLDPNFPQDRLRIISEDALIKVMITHSTIQDRAPEYEAATTIVIDQCRDVVASQPTENPVNVAHPHNILYVIYTSGSTGRPKGVLLEHHSSVNLLMAMKKAPGMVENDIMLAITTLSFDISVVEMFLPFFVGAKIVMADYEDTIDGHRLKNLIEQHHITFLQATPVTYRLLLEAGWEGTPDLKVICCGELLPVELAQQILPRVKVLYNQYGPTETTIYSTQEHVREITEPIPIGKPIDNNAIYVLDPTGQPTPIGVPGEVVIGGDGVSRGYLARPELTAEKYIPDPFIEREGARMYRSGDLARYLPNGQLQFYGRLDHQVKVRGFRIELGEIEALLDKHPRVKQSVAIVREDEPGNKQIVAYLVTKDGLDIKTSDLRSHVQGTLPGYMIPSIFVRLDELPLTPTGKINRRALPKPDRSDYEPETAYVEAENDVEKRIAEIWAEALNLPKVGMTDNFFELGGHSLLAIRIFAQIEKDFGKILPLSSLFQAPTPRQFATMLDSDSATTRARHPAVVAIQPNGNRPPVFCVGGGVLNLNNLSRKLAPDQPFYALQWQGLDRSRILDMSLEEAATSFIEAMRTVQPHGPYFLASSFTAGMIAVEMARQLDAQGEEIALLAGFDTVIADSDAHPIDFGIYAKKKRSPVAKFIGVVKKGPAEFWRHFMDPFYWTEVRQQIWKVCIAFLTTFHLPIPLWLRSGIYEEFFIRRASSKSNPENVYRGDFYIYLTPHYEKKYGVVPKFGWADRVAGDVTVVGTPGTPCIIMMEPNVDVLGRMFKEKLESVQEALKEHS